MVVTGLTLAVLTTAGFYVIYRKLPGSIQRWMARHSLLTDMIACALTYMLFGGTLIALFAAAWMGLLVSLMLAVANNPTCVAMIERWAKRFQETQKAFVNWLASLDNGQSTTTEKSHLSVVK